MSRLIDVISLIWQLPLFVFSLFFYRVTRWGFRRAVRMATRRGRFQREEITWKGLSDILAKPMGLSYVMVTGPRWNCHAIIGMVGPVSVQSFIEVNIAAAHKSAARWTLLIYSSDYATVRCFSSETCSVESWQRVQLNAGTYLITIRYYNCRNGGEFPAVNIDGLSSVNSRTIQEELRGYPECLERIRNYSTFFYLCLHYYVYFILLRQKLFVNSFVKREFLPVGNTETTFFYGILKKGETIKIDITQRLLTHSLVFFTFYNRGSFPVCWEEITQKVYRSQQMPCSGYYLLRVHGTIKQEKEVRLQVRITIHRGI